MRAISLIALLAALLAFNFARAADEEKPDQAALKLIGKPAPDFTLDLLGGGQAKLADHKGKVVIIDFWATWCPPCVAELPLIADVAKQRADKGVVFFAIDEEEEPADVEAFLKENKLTDLKVALDKKGEASKLYLVDPLPQTVVIGKDGIVKSVSIGIKSKDELAKVVDAALAEGTKN
jgi:thiol-disulfide isomerase/thioredoxin